MYDANYERINHKFIENVVFPYNYWFGHGNSMYE